MKYIAYCTKGLEVVVKDELSSLPLTSIIESGDKRVIFESTSSYSALTNLKTVDDIGIFLGKTEQIKSMEEIISLLDKTNFLPIQTILKEQRNIDLTSFSVTISAAKSSIQLIKKQSLIKDHLSKKYNWMYTERDHTNFDIKLFLDKTTLITSIRLTPESLHHRIYKTESRPGSLRPTVAAAMISLLDVSQGSNIIDNFCGSGTILCEAVSAEHTVYGGDIDTASTQVTIHNLQNLDYDHSERIKHQNAMNTSWPDHFFDAGLSNLPWDQQIPTESITTLYIGTLNEYKRILKSSAPLCLLVTKPELLIKHAKSIFPNSHITSYPIGLLGQNPSIVLIKR